MGRNDLVHIGDIVTLKPFKVINAYDGSFAAQPTVGLGASVPILNDMVAHIVRPAFKVGNLVRRKSGNQEMLKLLGHDTETDSWWVKQITGGTATHCYTLYTHALERDWHLVDTGAE